MSEHNSNKRSDQIASDLLHQIVSQDYASGSFLPGERELQSKYGVSRAVVREALRALSAMGVISSEPRKGAVVNPDIVSPLASALVLALTRSDVYLVDLLAVRMVIETQVVMIAATSATAAQLRELQSILSRMEADEANSGSNQDKDDDVNYDLHVQIARCTQNPVFVLFVEVIAGVIWKQTADDSGINPGEAQRKVALEQHRAIVNAIVAGDGETAQNAMHEHLMSTLANISEHQRVNIIE